MKALKMSDVRNLSLEELDQKIKASKDLLFRARFKHARRQLEDQMTLRQTRRNIARMMMVVREQKEKSHAR